MGVELSKEQIDPSPLVSAFQGGCIQVLDSLAQSLVPSHEALVFLLELSLVAGPQGVVGDQLLGHRCNRVTLSFQALALCVNLTRVAQRLDIVSLVGYLIGVDQQFFSPPGEQRLDITVFEKTEKNKNARIIKYVCPVCGTIIRATRQVNVKCGDCDVAFEAQ